MPKSLGPSRTVPGVPTDSRICPRRPATWAARTVAVRVGLLLALLVLPAVGTAGTLGVGQEAPPVAVLDLDGRRVVLGDEAPLDAGREPAAARQRVTQRSTSKLILPSQSAALWRLILMPASICFSSYLSQ